MRNSYTSKTIRRCRSYVFSCCVIFFISACGGNSVVVDPNAPKVDKVAEGRMIFANQCAECHGPTGEGVGGFPALRLPSCKSCDDVVSLENRIATSMPLNAELCSGTCAEYVSAFIFETFKPLVVQDKCDVDSAPIRRLTRFEYSNTIADLLGDLTKPGNDLPSEQHGNGFGNDATELSVSNLLVERYYSVADRVSQALVDDSKRWQKLHSCVKTVKSSTEQNCAKSIIKKLLGDAYRRPATNEEVDLYIQLQKTLRNGDSFKNSIGGVISAVLQSPDFLYRVEKGEFDKKQGKLKPTPYEIASRLSYLFWGSMPDKALLDAAKNGDLSSRDGILEQATRLMNDAKSRTLVRFFFDNYLPISALSELERDKKVYPDFSPAIGALMREETQKFLEHIIYDGPGDWPSALSAPYSFMNEQLADFYGVGGVSGDEFRQVSLDTSKRLGLLTQGGIMAGTTHSGFTNPVTRGAFVMKHLLCTSIPLPNEDLLDQVKPPDPTSGLTTRDRYSAHSENVVCASCHKLMDPVGLTFENYDAIGLYRTKENGVTIDTSGELPGAGTVSNAVELAHLVANDPRTQQCFAKSWADFAYGRTIGASDACLKTNVEAAFSSTDYKVKDFLLQLTQLEQFLYLPDNHKQ